MGLIFQVGVPSDVLLEDFAAAVEDALLERFGLPVMPFLQSTYVPPPQQERYYYSEEVAWSGWSELQGLAKSVFGPDSVPHLLGVEA